MNTSNCTLHEIHYTNPKKNPTPRTNTQTHRSPSPSEFNAATEIHSIFIGRFLLLARIEHPTQHLDRTMYIYHAPPLLHPSIRKITIPVPLRHLLTIGQEERGEVVRGGGEAPSSSLFEFCFYAFLPRALNVVSGRGRPEYTYDAGKSAFKAVPPHIQV
ncbi:hypothetical protein BDY19DRAFT_947047 [Irpex rosettiformis]|uniref:Uncharacterized protein n=1 Tax=Irpex rosettiformis TaxID=378272 RepID=A0ACB8U3V4_9APHY|nr:hypothetical protein BDY19DRAFT_947047 [Irpex rosettiformis]